MEKFTAVGVNVGQNLDQALSSSHDNAMVQQLKASLKAGLVTVIIYLKGNARVSKSVRPKLERHIKGKIGAFIKKKFPDIDIKTIIKNVKIEWQKIK